MPTNTDAQKKVRQPRRDALWRMRAHEAIESGDTRAVAALRPAVEATSKLIGERGEVDVALVVAVRQRCHETVLWLLEKSVDKKAAVAKIISMRGGRNTPLMLAAKMGALESMRALLPFSDANAVNADGCTALMLAAEANQDQAVLELLPVSDPNKRGANGASALMHGVDLKPEAFAALLRKSDPLAQNDAGDTALMCAAHWGQPKSVAILLPHSEPGHCNKNGKTAFDHANELKGDDHWAVLDLLAETAPREKVDVLFKDGGSEKMPRWAALREAEGLRNAIGESASASGEAISERHQSKLKKPKGAQRV